MAGIKRRFRTIKLATGLEFETEDSQLTFISATTGDKISEDIYPSRPSHKIIKKVDFSSNFSPDKNWFDYFNISNREGLEKVIPGFNTEEYISQVIANNSKNKLQRALNRREAKKRSSSIYL